MLLQELSSFSFFLLDRAWDEEMEREERQSFFVCATKGVFLFILFFHVKRFFYRQSKMGRAALHGFHFSLFPPFLSLSLSPNLSLSLHMVVPPRWKRLGMKIHGRR